jgi:dephospho-CoA kinase
LEEDLPLIIGLTGGIASGKSTVSSLLLELGAALVDADRIAREVVLPGEPTLEEVVSAFGQAIIAEDGSLHRKKLGEIVFADPQLRKKLESILHPAIRARMKEQMLRLEMENPKRLVVVDIPLMYESGLQDWFEEILLVYVPVEVQLQRLMSRDGLSKAEAQSRLAAQWSIEDKRELATVIIDNSGTLEETKRQVQAYYRGKVGL